MIYQCDLWTLIFICQNVSEVTSGTIEGCSVKDCCHGTRERIHSLGNIPKNNCSTVMSPASQSGLEMSKCKRVKGDTENLPEAPG